MKVHNVSNFSPSPHTSIRCFSCGGVANSDFSWTASYSGSRRLSRAKSRTLFVCVAEKRSVSVLLEPGAHIKLSRLLECDSNIKVIIFSSDERATIDGQGKSGLFRLRGGCSLTLRRLALVNGRAYNGGVVWAEGAGDVEIVDSTITDCEATQFGGGVYVASAEVNSAVSIVDTTITGVYARVARRLLHS